MTSSTRDTTSLHSLARRQAGAVSREQLRNRGFDSRAEAVRLARAEWAEKWDAIIICAESCPGDLQDAWALQISSSRDSIITGGIAARLQGLPITDPTALLIEPSPLHRPLSGVGIIRRLDPQQPVLHQGLRLADPVDALIDLLVALDEYGARNLLDRALQLRWIDAERLDHEIAQRAGRGRKGVGRLRRLHARAAAGSWSEAEHRMHPILLSTQLGKWIPNLAITDVNGTTVAVLDFALPELRLAIEVDGQAHHSDSVAFERDRRRQNLLHALGWLVLRFTWTAITEDPTYVAGAVRAAASRRAAS